MLFFMFLANLLRNIKLQMAGQHMPIKSSDMIFK